MGIFFFCSKRFGGQHFGGVPFLTCCLLLYVSAPMAVRNLSVLKATEKGDWAPDPETEPEGYHDFSVPMDMRNPRKVHLLISLLRI